MNLAGLKKGRLTRSNVYRIIVIYAKWEKWGDIVPMADVRFYRSARGEVPVLDWMKRLAKKKPRAYKKCAWLIEQLELHGHDLVRPHSGYLRDGIHELRARVGKVNYRVLYGFVGGDVALLVCGLTKERRVPVADIDRAVSRVKDFEHDPDQFGYSESE